jgi:hypothetical protein
MLVYDGTGLVLIWKRLEGSKFKWPAITDGVMRLSAAQLAALFEGLAWRRVYAPKPRKEKLPRIGPTESRRRQSMTPARLRAANPLIGRHCQAGLRKQAGRASDEPRPIGTISRTRVARQP